MAVDRALISGAYKANQPIDSSGSKQIGQTIKAVTDDAESYMKNEDTEAKKLEKKNNKSEKEYQAALDKAAKSSTLSLQERDSFEESIKDTRQKYIDTDTQGKSRIIAELNQAAGSYRSATDLYKYVGINAKEGGDLSSYWVKGEGKNWVEAIVNGNNTIVKKGDDYGYNVKGQGFKSISELEEEFKKYRKDNTFAKGIDLLAEKAMKENAGNNNLKFTRFNKARVEQSVGDLINSSPNLTSIAVDTTIGNGKSFKDNLTVGLVGMKYSELLGEYSQDDNNNGIIDKDEAENIMTHLLKTENEDNLKAELKQYFVKQIKVQGWDVGGEGQTVDASRAGRGEGDSGEAKLNAWFIGNGTKENPQYNASSGEPGDYEAWVARWEQGIKEGIISE
jgi:hypothetical protein